MLKELEDQFAVSGVEDAMRNFLQEKLASCCDSLTTDAMGNLHAVNQGSGPEFLLVTYMDEPGIIVTQITEDGYLRFETVGRINPSYLVSKRVFFGDAAGIISLKAIHLTTKKEREIPVKTSQLLIDIGASSKKEAEKIVEIGDYGVLDIPFLELENNFVKGRGIAGRMGCLAAMELLKKTPHRNIHVVFAVQREIGSRGIVACGRDLYADYTIIFDGITAKNYLNTNCDAPEAGKGVVLVTRHSCGILDNRLHCLCKAMAKDEDILLQCGKAEKPDVEAALAKTGQHRILSLSIPVRYADSAAPVANRNDMNGMIRLTGCVIEKLAKEEERA